MEKRQTVLVMAERSAEITAQLAARFGSRCELLFAENEPDFGAALSRADAIIGEPEEVQLQNARALSWLQLTWAGADKYARMARFPAGVTLCNVSGAFGTVISEYVLGSIVALYRALPVARLRHGRPRRKCCAAAVRVRRAGHGRPAHKT